MKIAYILLSVCLVRGARILDTSDLSDISEQEFLHLNRQTQDELCQKAKSDDQETICDRIRHQSADDGYSGEPDDSDVHMLDITDSKESNEPTMSVHFWGNLTRRTTKHDNSQEISEDYEDTMSTTPYHDSSDSKKNSTCRVCSTPRSSENMDDMNRDQLNENDKKTKCKIDKEGHDVAAHQRNEEPTTADTAVESQQINREPTTMTDTTADQWNKDLTTTTTNQNMASKCITERTYSNSKSKDSQPDMVGTPYSQDSSRKPDTSESEESEEIDTPDCSQLNAHRDCMKDKSNCEFNPNTTDPSNLYVKVPRSVERLTIDPNNPSSSRYRVRIRETMGRNIYRIYAGFFNTNPEKGVHLFFWFFALKNYNSSTPLIVWLQGEPGWSSMYGLFGEHGPYEAVNSTKGWKLKLRKKPWTEYNHVLYLDHCVGCGYSLAVDSESYRPTYENVGENVHEALRQFYKVFPLYNQSQLILAGSYAASKYIPVIATNVLVKNHFMEPTIPLEGIFITSPYYDAAEYAAILKQANFSDINLQMLTDRNEEYQVLITAGKYQQAVDYGRRFIIEEIRSHGFQNFYDTRYPEKSQNLVAEYMPEIIKSKDFRRMICLDKVIFQTSSEIIIEEIMPPVDHLWPKILENYKVLFKAGEFDLMSPWVNALHNLYTIRWKSIDLYYHGNIQPWCPEESANKRCVDGVSKHYSNLTSVLLLKDGHFMTKDRISQALMQWFYTERMRE